MTVSVARAREDWSRIARASARQLAIWAIRGALLTAALFLAMGYCLPIMRVPLGGVVFRMATLGALARTMSFHLGLLLLIPLVFAVMLRRKYLSIAATALIVWCTLPALADYRKPSIIPVEGETISIMTCNLLRPNRSYDEIASEITAADPDVICFQEYATHWHDALSTRLGERYSHRQHIRRRFDMGLAIYSKRPFIGMVEVHDFDEDPPAQPMRAVIEIAGRQVALYNLHMYQPWPASVARRRRMQFAGVREKLNNETLPVIIAGDYNATPTSPILAEMATLGYEDAWELSGFGRGSTWPDAYIVRHLPGIRIDHVYLSEELTCIASGVGTGAGSDHRPVTARVGFKSDARTAR